MYFYVLFTSLFYVYFYVYFRISYVYLRHTQRYQIIEASNHHRSETLYQKGKRKNFERVMEGYPGHIKVTVIRETRAIEYAK